MPRDFSSKPHQQQQMNDSNLMIWMMRLKQTEELIEKRKEDLAGHQQRRCNLQAELQQEQQLTVRAGQLIFVTLSWTAIKV